MQLVRPPRWALLQVTVVLEDIGLMLAHTEVVYPIPLGVNASASFGRG
jgi:hypothetical protein